MPTWRSCVRDCAARAGPGHGRRGTREAAGRPEPTLANCAVWSRTGRTAVAVFPKDLSQPLRSWAERSYRVTRYTVIPRAGHFAAHGEPDLLAADITEFCRPLR
jgi:pimeloyl-ACP methyl ester carboxylesterase